MRLRPGSGCGVRPSGAPGAQRAGPGPRPTRRSPCSCWQWAVWAFCRRGPRGRRAPGAPELRAVASYQPGRSHSSVSRRARVIPVRHAARPPRGGSGDRVGVGCKDGCRDASGRHVGTSGKERLPGLGRTCTCWPASLPVLSACLQPWGRGNHVHVHMCSHTHARTHTHALKRTSPHTGALTRLPHQSPASEEATEARKHPGAPCTGNTVTCFSNPAFPAPQALPGLPQKLQEVLVVVGGRALEDEEGAEEATPHGRNFAFYNTKASEYPSRCPCGQHQPLVSTLQVEGARCTGARRVHLLLCRGLAGRGVGGCRRV